MDLSKSHQTSQDERHKSPGVKGSDSERDRASAQLRHGWRLLEITQETLFAKSTEQQQYWLNAAVASREAAGDFSGGLLEDPPPRLLNQDVLHRSSHQRHSMARVTGGPRHGHWHTRELEGIW